MTATLLEILRDRGPTPSRDLTAALGVSQPTLSRLIAAASDSLVRIGRARATRYAARREIPGHGQLWPVYRIGDEGLPEHIAHLHAVSPRDYWYEPVGRVPSWLREDFAEGLFPGLPWPLDSLRAEGFLGRAFARMHGPTLGVADDPANWSDDDALRAILRFGDDLPGNLLVGDVALERFQRVAIDEVARTDSAGRASLYDQLAASAMAGDLPGSSAGGEQPKFCVRLAAPDGPSDLIVKFSPPRNSESGRRWADLLACEHLAAEVLREAGIPAVETTWLETSSRSYLEICRFDRVGERGRRGFVSLLSLDAAFYGRPDDWIPAAGRLQRDGWLDADDAKTLRVLRWFGSFIGNSDMHFANVSLALTDELPLRLAPTYDMLPMNWRPASSGEVASREFVVPIPPPPEASFAGPAAAMAVVFWQRVARDERISAGFRSTAAGAAAQVESVVREITRA